MSKRRNFYVYAIKVDRVVRYIGKGSNGRVHAHMSAVRALVRKTRKHVRGFHRKLHHAHTGGSEITHKFVKRGLTECQAYAAEARIIANYRKSQPGQLWNVTDGGSGYPILTPEQHAEVSARKSASLKKYYSDPAVCAAHRANIQQIFRSSPEWQANHKAAMHRVQRDPNVQARKRATFKRTAAAKPEMLKQRAAALKRTLADPVVRKRYSKARKRWFSDGENRERHFAALKQAMTPEVRARLGASLSNTLLNNPEVRAKSLAHIARLAADKELQRHKGAKLKRTLRDNPELLKRRTAAFLRTFRTPEYQRGFQARLKAVHADPAIQRRRLAAIRRAHKDPGKEARRLAGLRRYFAQRRAKQVAE